MSEVHRYKVVKMLSEDGNRISYDPHGPEVVLASAFDGATRLFLDAAERCIASERREKELQQRLTAADERVDLLEELLRNLDEEWNSHAGRAPFGRLMRKVEAALKPVGVGGDE